MVGINSSSYFSKLFFRQFGVTPKGFEKQCQQAGRSGDMSQSSSTEVEESNSEIEDKALPET